MASALPRLATGGWLLFCFWCGGGVHAAAAGDGASLPSAHWAFQPLAPPEPPPAGRGRSAGSPHPIDRFLATAQAAARVTPSAPATREQLIRRVTYDLTGLPPTPEEMDAFLRDRSTNAWPALVERLLASPRYGERWARHWLDLVRYAESDGFEHDALRPHSWRYRDYVIRSFNQDKPYDRFVQEQIAGDELWPGEPEALTATAFHLLGPDMVDSADQTQRRLNTLNDAVDTTASVFLGLTFGCARCHDHKFEPFTQRDYFGVQAFFAAARFERDLAIPTPDERARHEEAMRRYRANARSTQEKLEALEAPFREQLREERLRRLSEDAQLAHRTPKDRRTAEQAGTVEETAPMLRYSDAELLAAMPASIRAERVRLQEALKAIPAPAPLPMTLALQNSNGPAPPTFVLVRGDYANPREEVVPGFPAVLRGTKRGAGASGVTFAEPPHPAGRRTALAAWMTSPENPLTARVMVNRIWQHHFGRGLVASPSDFGTRGDAPAHPALLDWLAREFIAGGWSLKAVHRRMLTSAAYQRSVLAETDALARDPDNRLFARQNRARLEAEAVRDSLLAISGRLDPRPGGPSDPPPSQVFANTTASSPAASSPGTTLPAASGSGIELPGSARRSIYLLSRRSLRVPFLEAFDAPDNNLTCPERGRTTTAPQALTQLNSSDVIAASRATARRLLANDLTEAARLRAAYRWILGRAPSSRELALSRSFLADCRRRFTTGAHLSGGSGQPPADAPPSTQDLAAWSELCRALFNLNDFVYVD